MRELLALASPFIIGLILGAAVAVVLPKDRVSPQVRQGVFVGLFVCGMLVAQNIIDSMPGYRDPVWTMIYTLFSWIGAFFLTGIGAIGYAVGFFGFRRLERSRKHHLEDWNE